MIKKLLLIILGIILSFLFLETSFRVLAFSINIYKQYHAKKSLKPSNNEITILCIGESMTENQYPVYLKEELQKRGIANTNIIDGGIGGVTSDYLIKNTIPQYIEKFNPDIIVSMMGLMDKKEYNLKKIRSFKSKVLSFFYFYKMFNKGIPVEHKKLSNSGKKEDLDIKLSEKLMQADKYYSNRQFDKAIEIFSQLDFRNPLQKNAVHGKIDALKLSGHIKEVREYVLKKLDEDIFFNIEQTLKIADETDCIEIIKRLFPLNDKKLFRESVIKSLIYMNIVKGCMNRFNLTEEIKETDNILYNITNNDILFDKDKTLNPFSQTAINNYKTLIKICKEKNIQLIVMQYPTLSVEPYKLFFKNFKNIIYISNEENFKSELKNKLYFELFRDSFAGTFGHCTDYGNKLISKNLANTLEKILN